MRLTSWFILFAVLVSCKKDEIPVESPSILETGVLLMNEGLFQQNNSSLSWVNLSSQVVNNSIFTDKTTRALGDTGNDLKQYGGKIYVVVNVSSTIEVLSARTLEPVKQISMISNGVSKEPRNISFANGKAYVTCYDGFVDIIDTASLIVESRIQVGLNPEDLCVYDGKLYVSNSGGLNSPSMDSTVSVIELSTFTEIEKIVVGKNPGAIISDNYGDIYVVSRGNYSTIPSRMIKIDTQNGNTTSTFTWDVSGISKMNNSFLLSYYDFSSGSSSVSVFDPLNEQLVISNAIDLSNVSTLYAIAHDPFRNKLFVSDAMNFVNSGKLHQFSESGVWESSYDVGLNPSKMVFYE